jgi:NAD-dependent dihydropyrimidine dehydrogenase PreA subunit
LAFVGRIYSGTGKQPDEEPTSTPAREYTSDTSDGDGKDDSVTYVIAEPCIGLKDASCVEVCPVDCIHSDDDADQYFIDPDECIDCGVCAEVCPVEAIFFEDDLPEQWASFLLKNRTYFNK